MVNCWVGNILDALKKEIAKRKEERSRAIIVGLINWLLDDNLKIADMWEVEIKGIEEQALTDEYLQDLKDAYKLKDWEFEELKLMVDGCKAI